MEIAVTASLTESLRVLEGRGVRSLLVEGGAGLAGALLAERLADRLVLIRAPVILGAGSLGAFSTVPGVPLPGAPRLRVVRRDVLGEDHLTEFALREL